MPTIEELQEQNTELRRRLEEAEEALRAIREGQVDAIVVDGAQGAQVFSLAGAETVYRLAVETMAEAALNLTPDGCILFCNARFSEFVATPPELLLGRDLAGFVPQEQLERFRVLLKGCATQPVKGDFEFRAAGGLVRPVRLTGRPLVQASGVTLCLVAADLTELDGAAQEVDLLREHQRAMVQAQAELAESRNAALNMMEDAQEARRLAEQAAGELRAANEELTRFNRAMVGRELRMIELKKEINALLVKAGQAAKYKVEDEEAIGQ